MNPRIRSFAAWFVMSFLCGTMAGVVGLSGRPVLAKLGLGLVFGLFMTILLYLLRRTHKGERK